MVDIFWVFGHIQASTSSVCLYGLSETTQKIHRNPWFIMGLVTFGFLFLEGFFFFRGRFWIIFGVPGSMLSCFSAFLLLCFPCFFAFLLLCFPCFSAFVLLCLSTSTIILFLFFSHVFLLLYFLLLASLLPVFTVSLFSIFFCFILFCLYPK